MKSVKINIPQGFEIDKEKSTFEEIIFKKIAENENEYEILSVYGKPNCGNSTTVYTVIDKTTLVHPDGKSIYPQKNLNSYPIHSIKRLSDGEIFTIGDEISDGKISRFTLNSTKEHFGVNVNNHFATWINFKCIRKRKYPLFKTEDGIDVFKGDTIYYVETNEEPHYNYKPLEYNVKSSGRFTTDITIFAFSTKEKSEEWILYNKPTNLSLNDILSAWGVNRENGKTSLLFRRIERLVIQKNNSI